MFPEFKSSIPSKLADLTSNYLENRRNEFSSSGEILIKKMLLQDPLMLESIRIRGK